MHRYIDTGKYHSSDYTHVTNYAGGAITDLTAVQMGLTVFVTWTAPPGPPAGGYQITVTEANVNVSSQDLESPFAFTTSKHGVHNVQVKYTSQHFPSEVASVMLTVRG